MIEQNLPTPNSQELLLRIEAGDDAAAAAVFDRYVERLVALARARVGAKLRRRIDAEDVVQSAYRSFFVHAENHEYELSEGGDLWRLLARITLNKLYSQVEKHTAARRSIRREDSGTSALAEPVSVEPTAAEVIALTERVQIIASRLTNDEQEVLRAHLAGGSVNTIAATIQKSQRAVRRLLEQARNKMEAYLTSDPKTELAGTERRQLLVDQRAPLGHSDYRLERLLGAGGMGKVYQATQVSTGKTVAIKALVKSRQADPSSVEKFLQEAQILGSLNHPNIVRFQGVGRFPGGGYFFVMDYIDGGDLQARIDKRPLFIEETMRVVCDVGRAVANVHEQGVVHGDLKPANVLIDRGGKIFVTDFGLAQFSALMPGQRPWLVGGTAGYVAPEVRIHGQLPSPKSDVFGLGALIWSLMTGHIPHLPLIAPDQAEMPQSVLAVCARCLADDPARRFRSVAELIGQLDSLGIAK